MYMFKYILKRVLLMLFVFFCGLTICFVMIKLLPTTPAEQFGKDASIVLQRREALGYNKPILVQFGIFCKKSLLGGDWGISETLYRGQEVWSVFVSKLPATIIVNFYSVILSVPLGIVLGIYAALKKNKWQDYTISTLIMLFISVPGFCFAFYVQYFLCYKLGWFPMQMKAGTDWFSWPMFVSIVPASLSLSFGSIAGYARTVRAELSEVLTSDFMLLARTKGLTKGQATVRHALRISMVPVFPGILAEIVSLLSGSMIIEQIFGIPGVGALTLNSITALDYNMYLLMSAFYSIIGLGFQIVFDISYGIIDPRIRMGAR